MYAAKPGKGGRRERSCVETGTTVARKSGKRWDGRTRTGDSTYDCGEGSRLKPFPIASPPKDLKRCKRDWRGSPTPSTRIHRKKGEGGKDKKMAKKKDFRLSCDYDVILRTYRFHACTNA